MDFSGFFKLLSVYGHALDTPDPVLTLIKCSFFSITKLKIVSKAFVPNYSLSETSSNTYILTEVPMGVKHIPTP